MCARFEYLVEFETRAQQQQSLLCGSVEYFGISVFLFASVLSVDSEWPNRQGIAWTDEVEIFQCSMTTDFMTNSTHRPVCLGEGGHHGYYVCLWLWREIIVICGRCGLALELLKRNTEVKY